VTLSDDAGGKVKIDATTASELTFGVGHYFREYCTSLTTLLFNPSPLLKSPTHTATLPPCEYSLLLLFLLLFLLLLFFCFKRNRRAQIREPLLSAGNMTIGWKRGGGSNLFIPKSWAKIGAGKSLFTILRMFSYIPPSHQTSAYHAMLTCIITMTHAHHHITQRCTTHAQPHPRTHNGKTRSRRSD
jgi:hypothetical protein